jgi:hypothetical protein
LVPAVATAPTNADPFFSSSGDTISRLGMASNWRERSRMRPGVHIHAIKRQENLGVLSHMKCVLGNEVQRGKLFVLVNGEKDQ